jgi:predicted NUDIX family phosphoesterase
MSERVLVVPTALLHELGWFHGFCPDVERYLDRLLAPEQLSYRPRDEMEQDPTFKQLIPYVVLRHRGQLFHYQRAGGGEKRLHARRSIGIGGHICCEDGVVGPSAYRTGMLRELSEEVQIGQIVRERCIGLINDDRTSVGQVHLGIVHVCDLIAPQVSSREAALTGGGFASLEELRQHNPDFETWSQFLLAGEWLAGEP